MSKSNVPKSIRQQIDEVVAELADGHHYLASSRAENSVFMDQLVAHPRVGALLEQFMPKGAVRTYIKDAVLNKYSKERRKLPRDIRRQVSRAFGRIRGELAYDPRDGVSLYQLTGGSLVAVARTSYEKWETGLRKLLLFIANAPNLPPTDGKELKKAVFIHQPAGAVNIGERAVVDRALELVSVRCVWG
ncbi:hypothetical protein ACFL09_04060 [Planctomycetota bacterium]